MQSLLIDLLLEKHILVGIEPGNAHEAIVALNNALVASGHTQPDFATDVWEREQTYPTGLPTQPLAVAIPHADPQNVNRTAVCLGVLKDPVKFPVMGTDGSQFLDAGIVFLLAIKEREKQVEMIRQLMALIQNPALLSSLAQAESPRQALELIHKTLG